jgi:single-stranded DNA-binding protein
MTAKVIRKGSHVYIEGSLEVRKWIGTNGEGQNWTVEIVVNGFDGRLVLLDPPPSDKLEDRDAGTEGLDATDDTDTAGLSRFLQAPDDSSRARIRTAGDDDMRGTG